VGTDVTFSINTALYYQICQSQRTRNISTTHFCKELKLSTSYKKILTASILNKIHSTLLPFRSLGERTSVFRWGASYTESRSCIILRAKRLLYSTDNLIYRLSEVLPIPINISGSIRIITRWFLSQWAVVQSVITLPTELPHCTFTDLVNDRILMHFFLVW
jgi:hypothetical protein